MKFSRLAAESPYSIGSQPAERVLPATPSENFRPSNFPLTNAKTLSVGARVQKRLGLFVVAEKKRIRAITNRSSEIYTQLHFFNVSGSGVIGPVSGRNCGSRRAVAVMVVVDEITTENDDCYREPAMLQCGPRFAPNHLCNHL